MLFDLDLQAGLHLQQAGNDDKVTLGEAVGDLDRSVRADPGLDRPRLRRAVLVDENLPAAELRDDRDRGTVKAFATERRTRSTLANAPGTKAPSGLGQRARTRSDRVVASMLGSMA